MNGPSRDFAHQTAVDIYGAFLEECIIARVGQDRDGQAGTPSAGKIDGRPVRLVTISGKGGWSKETALAERWSKNDNVSLLDHLLSVARGALMFWMVDAPRPWSTEADMAEIRRLAHALVCIAFLHDIDKDLQIKRGAQITVAAVAERMTRYGIDEFLLRDGLRVSPAAMLNYIEEVEGTQAARNPAASDYDRRIAAMCRYVELADKMDGMFTSHETGAGIDGVIKSLRDANRWPVLRDSTLKHWEKIEIHDHLHVFLLDRFQRAISDTCTEVAGRLPLIEIVHDGRLLCVIPREQAGEIRQRALDRFLRELPYGLDFSINNRLALEFTGGAASWQACRDLMARDGNWLRRFANLLALPRPFAVEHQSEIEDLFAAAGMETSWSPLVGGAGATVKPALDHPGGDPCNLDMNPAHALTFLVMVLNHNDSHRKGAAPVAKVREGELLNLLGAEGKKPPPVVTATQTKDGRTRRILIALWTIAEVWRSAESDPDGAQELLDHIAGPQGLVKLWLEGDMTRAGLAAQIENRASAMRDALRRRFTAYLTGSPAQAVDGDDAPKRCLLCNEPVADARKVDTASEAHGVKASAFSGRDGRNDHLASPSGDTHICPVCLAELQLRQKAQEEFKGAGDLPPLISSPATTGLFAALAFERERNAEVSMGLNDLNRLELKKGTVYDGLDCQTRRIRLARLERLPNRDAELVTQLRMTLNAVRRLGRPIHIFRGAPSRNPAIFHSDALPPWLERLLGGSSLRIEQLPEALADLELFEYLAHADGLGIEWAKQLADPDKTVRLGALCVAWTLAADRRATDTRKRYGWSIIRDMTRERALVLVRNIGGEPVNLKDNTDPLIRLAWLASCVQKRRSSRDSTNKQLLCWKTALDFYAGAVRSVSQDSTALILGLAGTLEEELTRKSDAAAKKHRDDRPLNEACIDFASHFANEVWPSVFQSREPTSKSQRRAAAIYRFALLEAYRERGIAESAADGLPPDEAEEV